MNKALQTIRLYAQVTLQDEHELTQQFKASVKAQKPRNIPEALDLWFFHHVCDRFVVDLENIVDVDELIADSDPVDDDDKVPAGSDDAGPAKPKATGAGEE